MATVSLWRENFVLHKLHSLTGVVPVGYYMVQHLVLNSFNLAGADKFNAVIDFFEGMPKGFLLAIEVSLIWVPLLFHAIYGVFIVGRAHSNFIGTKYGWSQNLMYSLQRWSGIVLFFFLIYHVLTTTAAKYYTGDANVVKFAAWHDKLTSYGHALLFVYLIGVACAAYHLSYGVWNFCIRWGITIGDRAQTRVQQFSAALFVALTVLGWWTLFGFLKEPPAVTASLVLHSTRLG